MDKGKVLFCCLIILLGFMPLLAQPKAQEIHIPIMTPCSGADGYLSFTFATPSGVQKTINQPEKPNLTARDAEQLSKLADEIDCALYKQGEDPTVVVFQTGVSVDRQKIKVLKLLENVNQRYDLSEQPYWAEEEDHFNRKLQPSLQLKILAEDIQALLEHSDSEQQQRDLPWIAKKVVWVIKHSPGFKSNSPPIQIAEQVNRAKAFRCNLQSPAPGKIRPTMDLSKPCP